MNEQQRDRKDLKIQALLERITMYENNDAERRVDLTLLQEQLGEAHQKIQQLEAQNNHTPEQPNEVVHQITDVPGDDSD